MKKILIIVIVLLLIVIYFLLTKDYEKSPTTLGPEKIVQALSGTSTSQRVISQSVLYPPFHKDNNFLYYYGQKIDGADMGTVNVISDEFFADKRGVFDPHNKIEGLSPENIRIVTNWPFTILANDTQVYLYVRGFINGRPITTVKNPKSLRPVWKIDDVRHILTDDQEIYVAAVQFVIPMNITNPLPIAESLYIKGQNSVMYKDKLIRGADPLTFQILKESPPKLYSDFRILYAKDKSRVYYMGVPIIGADPKTFKVYESRYYEDFAHDSNQVYYNGEAITGADPKSFVILRDQPYEGCGKDPYSKDSKNVFYKNATVLGADPDTFQNLLNGFGKDSSNSYLHGERISIPPKDLDVQCFYG